MTKMEDIKTDESSGPGKPEQKMLTREIIDEVRQRFGSLLSLKGTRRTDW